MSECWREFLFCSQLTLDPLGGADDDEDDLFSSKPKSKAEEESKPEVNFEWTLTLSLPVHTSGRRKEIWGLVSCLRTQGSAALARARTQSTRFRDQRANQNSRRTSFSFGKCLLKRSTSFRVVLSNQNPRSQGPVFFKMTKRNGGLWKRELARSLNWMQFVMLVA